MAWMTTVPSIPPPRTVMSAAALIALCLANAPSIALAQPSNTPPAALVRHAAWTAPVGTRQPTEADLPPNLRRDEGAATPRQRQFDQSLTICRNC